MPLRFSGFGKKKNNPEPEQNKAVDINQLVNLFFELCDALNTILTFCNHESPNRLGVRSAHDRLTFIQKKLEEIQKLPNNLAEYNEFLKHFKSICDLLHKSVNELIIYLIRYVTSSGPVDTCNNPQFLYWVYDMLFIFIPYLYMLLKEITSMYPLM